MAGEDHFPVALSLFPFAIWGALRFGSLGAATVTLIVSWLAIQGIVQGAGPFVVESGVENQIRWCLFTDIMAITGLLLGAIRSEREKALAALRDSNKALEWQVQQRTLELTQANADLQAALAERRRLQLEMNQITEERQKMAGQELHDGLGQQLTGIAFMINSLRETLAARSAPEAPVLQQVGGLLRRSDGHAPVTVPWTLSHRPGYRRPCIRASATGPTHPEFFQNPVHCPLFRGRANNRRGHLAKPLSHYSGSCFQCLAPCPSQANRHRTFGIGQPLRTVDHG